MRNKIVLFLIGSIVLSLVDIQAQNVTGTYVQDEMKNIKLHFSEDLFLFEDDFNYTHSAPYNCSDTLAFGYWELDDNQSFMKLYTNPIQYSSLVNMEVEETTCGSPDSIYLDIQNPIEEDFVKYNKGNEQARIIYYRINIETKDAKLDYEVNIQKYYSNEIAFKSPKNNVVKSIELTVYPKNYDIGWRSNMPPYFVYTLTYEPQNAKANLFKINMPELTRCYLCTLRLNGDFIKILNNYQLEWDGHIYTKE
jgi:hypothetical protein